MSRLSSADVEWIMRGMARAITGLELPVVEKIAEEAREDAFRVLIATILSARTQDATTAAASDRLFRKAPDARRMADLPVAAIARLIYPVSFYRTKARHVKAACRQLLDRFGGRVPGTMEELLTLPGVVATRTPEQTEQSLYERVPARWWPYLNLYLVTWGQNVCRPTHPRCGDCAVARRCPRLGVTTVGKSRTARA